MAPGLLSSGKRPDVGIDLNGLDISGTVDGGLHSCW